ncbi:RNA-binding protein 7 [Malaya genurostris]|uniref:RNA-binding protein 7 n=1 Tax=Malaya genurostris TaxID=325434 RepID=UPI0026F40731|nr:RNA-binding protein 7 [Malaya genurostris]
MSEEDERTLWCGNLSEKVTEELLYELFLQAGPLEMVKIPKDNDKRQRSYAFITYAHAVSVEYAIDIFEGTKLFQRPLTLHKKTKNGANSNASPRMNQRGQQHQNQQGEKNDTGGAFSMATMSPGTVNQMIGMMAQMHPQALAGLGQLQQDQIQNKMNRNDNWSHHQHKQQYQKPYSRDNQKFSRDRNESQAFSRDHGGNHRGNRGGGGGHQRRNDHRGRR